MSTLQALLLGIIQGLTEFLPVSSSAHLTFAEHILSVPKEGRLALDVLLHLGTLLSLLVFFATRIVRLAGDLFRPDPTRQPAARRILLAIVIGTVPAGVIGYLLSDKLDIVFETTTYSAVFLLVTGCVLFATRWSKERKTGVGWLDGLVVGCAQAVSLLPGISRSGSTIAASLFQGLGRSEAFEFSFLLSIPAVLGAALLKLKDSPLMHGGAGPTLPLLLGIAVSFVTGLLALFLLRRVLLKKRLHWFAYYCWIVGAVALVLSLIRR
jgi:undecaprenyl-diphosphatase